MKHLERERMTINELQNNLIKEIECITLRYGIDQSKRSARQAERISARNPVFLCDSGRCGFGWRPFLEDDSANDGENHRR